MEDSGVSVEEELVAVNDVVVAEVQLPAVVRVGGQAADAGLWIPGSQPVRQKVELQECTKHRHVSVRMRNFQIC